MMDVVDLNMWTTCTIETSVLASRVKMLEVHIEEDNFGTRGQE